MNSRPLIVRYKNSFGFSFILLFCTIDTPKSLIKTLICYWMIGFSSISIGSSFISGIVISLPSFYAFFIVFSRSFCCFSFCFLFLSCSFWIFLRSSFFSFWVTGSLKELSSKRMIRVNPSISMDHFKYKLDSLKSEKNNTKNWNFKINFDLFSIVTFFLSSSEGISILS